MTSNRFFMGVASLALALTMVTGCGANTAATTAAVSAPDSQQVTAQDYQSVSRAQRVAADALYRYNDLLRQWDRAYSDREKDQIEMSMLSTLTQGLTDIRQIASNGYGYDSRRVYDISDRALSRYEDLRRTWERTYDNRTKREIVNDMLTLLTSACKQVQAVRA